MARLTAAGDLPSLRPAPARLPWLSAATNTFIASIRSTILPQSETLNPKFRYSLPGRQFVASVRTGSARRRQLPRRREPCRLQAAADFAHAAAEPAAQQRPQSHAFGIADLGGDLVDAGVAGPEKVHRALYPQILEVGERRLAQHALHPARQGALAGGQRLHGLVERETFSQASARPALEVSYQRFGMGQMVWDRVDRLRSAHVRHQVPCGEVGQLRTGAPDEGQCQVEVA